MAQMMRAILLASASAATFFALRASNPISHGEARPGLACCMTAVAPSTSSRRKSSSPALLILPSRCRPAVESSSGVMPIGGVSFALKVPDPKAFHSGRHFAAWIGITPREDSTAGRHRLGRISKAGDEDLRRLLVLGATAVIQQAKPGRASPWLMGLLARKAKKVAALALANKMARIIWAMMVSGETYRRTTAV